MRDCPEDRTSTAAYWAARDAALAQIRGQLSRWAAATPPAPK